MKSMKSKIYKLGIAAMSLVMAAACTEIKFGDEFLGDAPESSGSTLETMFSSRVNSETVLTRAYMGLPYGITYLNASGTPVFRFGVNPIETLTDLCQSFFNANQNDSAQLHYYSGMLSAASISSTNDMYYFGNSDWTTVKYAWIYLENVDKVPNMTDAEKAAKKAEAKVVLAVSYFNMVKHVGAVPWIDHSIGVNENMHFPRATFAETIDNIVALLDDAIAEPGLPWKWDANNDGRMSKAGAMALKFKVLQFAASPMFNSNTKWHPEADEYTCYGNYDVNRWIAAQQAGKAFFDAVKANGEYSLIQPTAQTHQARRLAYRSAYYDRGGTEILISLRKGNYSTDTYGTDAGAQLYSGRYYIGPTLDYVDMFPWEDGSDFPADNFDWENPSRDPFFANESTVPTRDPRLYETVAVPGDNYFNNGSVPTYKPHSSYHDGSGFLQMKFILQQASDRANRPVQWPHTRLAEIMLGYAEVLNEVNGGPTAEAYRMVNEVRARVGLKAIPSNLSQDAFREAVLKERALELGFEEIRWFDLIRWNRSQDFRKALHGLEITGNAADMATSFKFKKVELPKRAWQSNWDSKWYLSPIPQKEINKNYGMTQNPGW